MREWTDTRSGLTSKLEALDLSRTQVGESGMVTDGMFAQSRARIVAQLAETDGLLAIVAERDEIQAGRPDDCACLGTGGVGALVAGLSDGLVIFDRYCSCSDGERVAESASWATASSDEQSRVEHAVDEALRREAREREVLTRSGIDYRYRDCTFESLRNVLRRRGFLKPRVSDALDTFERSYTTNDLGRGDYLWGPPGHAKTSLAVAMLRARIARGQVGYFQACSDLSEQLKIAYGRRDGSGDELMNRLRLVPVLVLDDVAMVPMYPGERARIVNLIVNRHSAGGKLVTVFTSQHPPEDVARILTGDDTTSDVGRITGRIMEMCDVTKWVTGDLRAGTREHALEAAGGPIGVRG